MRVWLPGLPALLLLAVFFIAPYGALIDMSLRHQAAGQPFGAGHTLGNYAAVLGDPFYRAALLRTLLTGAVIDALTLLLAYPLALHLARAGERWHVLCYAAIVSPLLVGVLVRNFGWMILLSFSGPINRILVAAGLLARPARLLFNQGVVVLALVHVFIPFMVLPLAGSLRGIDPGLYRAARSLGAGPAVCFWHITLPLSFPGLRAGLVLVFVLAVSAYVTPALLGGQAVALMPQLIIDQLTGAFAWPFGGALAVVLALATLAVVAAFGVLTRGLARRVAA
jgi:putative spermidine/putrescine transport system permease protein